MPGFQNNIGFANGFKLQPSSATDISNMQQVSTDISQVNHTGDPNGSVAANPGSTSHDPVSGNIWQKASGTGNTGWVLMSGSGPVIGQPYLTTQVVDTNISGGSTLVEDRTWHTPYVVDSNATIGQRGTFTTIQAAINQADADGNSTNPRTALIHIRQGTYTENLTFNVGGWYYLYAEKSHRNEFISPPRINSTTNWGDPDSPRVTCYGLELNWTLTQTGLVGAPSVYFENCLILSNINFNHGFLNFSETYYPSGTLTLGAQAALEVYDRSDIFTLVFNSSTNAQLYCTNSKIRSISGSNGSSGIMHLFDSQFSSISGDFPADPYGNIIVNCSPLLAGFPGSPMITATGNFYVSGCTGLVYDSSPTIFNLSGQQGDIIDTKLTATSYSATQFDYYIGVTSTAAARTITLPSPVYSVINTIPRNKSFIIKDQSGGANTHNITINTVAGTIDGASSATISSNYGSITLKSDGTNYYTINQEGISITGDSGIISGKDLTIYAHQSTNTSGASVYFTNSGTTSTLNLTDHASQNTYMGWLCGNVASLATSVSNTGAGVATLNGVTSSSYNAVFGANSFSSLSGGLGGNTGIGYLVANSLLTGSNNFFGGSNSGASYTGAETNNILIMHGGVVGENNTIRIGTIGFGTPHTSCYIGGITGNTVSNAQVVTINSSTGQMGVATNIISVCTDVTSATQTIAVGNSYTTDRSGGVVYTLPATASFGDLIEIVGKLGISTITPNANQQIVSDSASGTVGVTGTAVGQTLGSSIQLRCITGGSSTVWRQIGGDGSWTLN